MFGLGQVKWFVFIPKRPKQTHPQLVRCWVLVHSGQSSLTGTGYMGVCLYLWTSWERILTTCPSLVCAESMVSYYLPPSFHCFNSRGLLRQQYPGIKADLHTIKRILLVDFCHFPTFSKLQNSAALKELRLFEGIGSFEGNYSQICPQSQIT